MSLQIWIPPSAREKERFFQCEIPGCDKRFPLSQESQFHRHVKACLRRNGERIEAHLHNRETDPLTAIGDTEYYLHLRKGGN